MMLGLSGAGVPGFWGANGGDFCARAGLGGGFGGHVFG